MSFSSAARSIIRIIAQQMENTAQAVVPAIKGIANPPQHNRAGIIKIFSVGAGSLFLGHLIAHGGATYLEHSGWFVPADDDDDDD